MEFKVFRTKAFEKQFKKLPKIEREEIENFEKDISKDPFLGKPLGYIFFREKRLDGRRVYYLVYEDYIVILMVAISNKKTQQATINKIKERLDEYQQIIKQTLKKF